MWRSSANDASFCAVSIHVTRIHTIKEIPKYAQSENRKYSGSDMQE